MDHRKTVLVVEDDHAIRDVVAFILKNNGYEVHEAADGAAALKEAEKVDVVLLDLLLPKISGAQFLKTIRAQGNCVPVVLMSAAVERGKAMSDLEEYSIVDFIHKPFNKVELIDKVNRACSVSDDMRVVKRVNDRLESFISRQAAKS